MDTTNSLNNTSNTQDSQNPQGTATPGANNGADFQQTAPSDTLNQEAENLSVEKTGDPITGLVVKNSEAFPVGWAIAVVVMVVIAGWVLIRLLKEQADDDTPAAPPVRAVSSAKKPKPAVKKTAAKKPVAKKAPAKKPAAKKRKKTAKKR